MVTGTIHADTADLVIDALKAIVGHVYQYAYLITMLGIKKIIVAVNKIDCLLYNKSRFVSRADEIKKPFEELHAEVTAIILISARYGDNVVVKSDRMKWYTSRTLEESLERVHPGKSSAQLPFRLVVYCPHITKGRITILGTVISGKLFKGQQLTFGPDHHITKVLSIKVSTEEKESVEAPASVSFALEDSNNVERGQIGFDVSSPPLIADYLIAHAFWIDAKPINPADEVDILCGTQYCSGQVETISEIQIPACLETDCVYTRKLNDLQAADVRIKLNSPICVDPFNEIPGLGRFATIQYNRITGGGVLE